MCCVCAKYVQHNWTFFLCNTANIRDSLCHAGLHVEVDAAVQQSAICGEFGPPHTGQELVATQTEGY